MSANVRELSIYPFCLAAKVVSIVKQTGGLVDGFANQLLARWHHLEMFHGRATAKRARVHDAVRVTSVPVQRKVCVVTAAAQDQITDGASIKSLAVEHLLRAPTTAHDVIVLAGVAAVRRTHINANREGFYFYFLNFIVVADYNLSTIYWFFPRFFHMVMRVRINMHDTKILDV